MSQQIVSDLFTNVVEAAPRVGESAFGNEVRAVRECPDPGLRVGWWGQRQEWKNDVDDRKNDHRHVSHLFALHPGRQISIAATPTLAEAARVSLDAAAMAAPVGARRGRSTSGLGAMTATAHTNCSASNCARARCRTCSIRNRRSRSTTSEYRWTGEVASLESPSLCGQFNVARSFPCRTQGSNARSWRKAASTIFLRRRTSQ